MPAGQDKIWGQSFRFRMRAVWSIFWEARKSFSRDGCLNLAAALAFYSILSLIPFLFLLVSAAGYLLGSSDDAYESVTSFFDRLYPHSGTLRILAEVRDLSHRAAGVLGWVGILSMIWTASIIFSSLEYALGIVFRAERRRDFFKSKLLALSMVPGAAVIFFLSLSVTAFTGIMSRLEWVHPLLHSEMFEFAAGYLFPYLILTCAFTGIYKIIPNTPVSLRHAAAGGFSCAFLFEVAKHFFTWYIGRSTHYNVIYGSLEAMVILVLWVFYSSGILLFCAELVSAYRRRDVALLEKAFF